MKKLLSVIAACVLGVTSLSAQQTAATASLPVGMESAKVVFFPVREAILASRIDGVVLENKLRLGQRFKSGEVLVKLDDTRFLIELERVKALEKESIALSEFAVETLKSQEDMFKQNMISEIDYKKAKLDVETSAARLLAIKANLKEAQNQLSYCVIAAPFAGRLEEISTRAFETLRAGQPLLRLIDDNYLKAVMFVPVEQMDKLKLGTEISLVCTDTNQKLVGKIYEIAPRADHRSGTIEIRALVDNTKGEITAGMTGVFYYARTR